MQPEEKVVPKHLGIIMDGNRRWARDNGLPTLDGHKKGLENVKTIARHAFDRGVEVVSIYAFSTENWNRSKSEVDYLMNLAVNVAKKEAKNLSKENIRIIVIGAADEKVPSKVMKAWQEVEAESAGNTGGTLAVCFNYGGTREIVDAVKSIVEQGTSAGEISEDTVQKHLYHPEVPEVDFMIRTSGEKRISNFMLWRMRYAEMEFVAMHWPAFSVEDLDSALDSYAIRNRRLGGD